MGDPGREKGRVGLLLGGGAKQHVASGQMHHYLAMLDMDAPEAEASDW